MTTGNRLRDILNENGKSLATRISSRWGMTTELAAACGCYDYVEYLLEYAPFQVEDLENLARTCELHGMGSIAKVDFQNRGWWSQKALAAGIQGILFTDCKSPAEVEECIALTMPDSPAYGGRFGFSNYRWIGAKPVTSQTDYAAVMANSVRIFMIEKKDAVDRIEEICCIPGVDMIQFGPADYSMSCGRDVSDPAWTEHRKEAERHCIRTALSHGVQPRCEIESPADAKYYADLGVKHFCLGDEMKILRGWWRENGQALRNSLF
ncbi:MAG: aldolase/citrate lyase family protein [Eubacteriales bacterium]|nr:aldolase/citrate lyase family protein [Eubacteriales bacterium]